MFEKDEVVAATRVSFHTADESVQVFMPCPWNTLIGKSEVLPVGIGYTAVSRSYLPLYCSFLSSSSVASLVNRSSFLTAVDGHNTPVPNSEYTPCPQLYSSKKDPT